MLQQRIQALLSASKGTLVSLYLEGWLSPLLGWGNKLSVLQDRALAFAAFQCVGVSAVCILLASTFSSQIFPENWAEQNTVPEREQLIKQLCAAFWC